MTDAATPDPRPSERYEQGIECGDVLHLKDWPDAMCHKPLGHPSPHEGETGSAGVSWPVAAAPVGGVLPSNPATFEYRNTAVIPWREADHRNHPTADHYCACICEERVLAGCPEHGWQVPRERREVRTSYGEWESV